MYDIMWFIIVYVSRVCTYECTRVMYVVKCKYYFFRLSNENVNYIVNV